MNSGARGEGRGASRARGAGGRWFMSGWIHEETGARGEGRGARRAAGRRTERRGFALGMVLFVIVIFLILGAVILTNTYQEIPAVARIDRNLEARYLARSLAEAVQLKLKNHPQQFEEALREKELAAGAGGGGATRLYDTWLADFSDADTVRDKFGLGDGRISGRVAEMRRLYVGAEEAAADAGYVTDVVDLSIDVTYLAGGERGIRDSSEVTLRLTERLKFRRRFTKS